MLERLRTTRGIGRSLRIYYGDQERRAELDRFYSRFVRPDDLVFDIGAHVGDRVGAFRRLGARVVAVEPQPALIRTLRLLYGRDPEVILEQTAVGREQGFVDLKINLENPTVSTVSAAFIGATEGARGWEGQEWGAAIQVPTTTLDALIAKHGEPRFIKIDVEGFEAEVLAGLSHPASALSFEFTTIQREVALACVERCTALGYRGFDAVLGESLTFVHGRPVTGAHIAQWVSELPDSANSGDIYATLS
jgi:FkbM family methyltransferase